jgi:uncharacterized coiled-coil DUF342 family protein
MAKQDEINEYKELIKLRDEILEKVVPVQGRLDRANATVIEAQTRAQTLADEITKIKGGNEWLKLKARIAFLAMRGAGKAEHKPEPEKVENVGFFRRKFFR